MNMLQVVNCSNPKEFKTLHLVKVELALEMKNLGVVGLDLSGNPGIGEWYYILPIVVNNVFFHLISVVVILF